MSSRIIAVDPFDLIVFGGTGDLTYRKLLPAMYHRHRDAQLPDEARIVGVSRRALSDEEYRAETEKALRKHVSANELEAPVVAAFLDRLHYVAVDAKSDNGWDALRSLLADGEDRVRAFYLAVDPALFGTISAQIGSKGLVTPKTRVIIEKPIGHDLASANEVNDAVGSVFDESQIYRIDHYLGKETVQNLMALRFANALFEPLWNADHIDHVQITVAETLGVEGRGAYYDHSGALRDIVQNHIIQLLCLVAMEPPAHMDADSVRDEKLKVIRALLPIGEHNASALTVRGQYRAGNIGGASVPSYLSEVEDGESRTETFVAIKAGIGNWRWAGVPFYLRTGKRLAARVSEIVIAFKRIPHSIFDQSVGEVHQNQLVIRLQPDEGVKLWLMIKDPGPGGMRLVYVPLDMSFAQAFKVRSPDAYERLILDVIRGNQTLFMRRDEVEAAWQWIDPILEAWSGASDQPKPYAAGTWGPSASFSLLGDRTWHDLVE
ncbi:MAG: glucose-6-phosphate dehydrogenase [Rhizobiales bacterium]|nr:glucose-6-phosphate dehydrogenase [Hyphomicrobiales bacterium]